MRDLEPGPVSRGGSKEIAREATLHDVARKVGVSPRTVSRVVNDEGGYSETTRQRVLAAISELRYRPNLLARGLIRGRSSTVALVGGDMNDPMFPALFDGIQNRVRERGFTMFVATTGNDPDGLGEVLKSMWSHAVEGVVVFPAAGPASELVEYAGRGLPIVVVDYLVDAPNVGCVLSDFDTGAHLGVRHLLDTGRRRLAMIGSSFSPLGSHRDRSFLAAVEEAIGTPAESVVGPPTLEGGAAALSELLERRPDLDGVIAHNDLVAIGAMRSALGHGRRVPDDIAVVGIDDIEVSALVTPALTTIRLSRTGLTEAVARSLHDLIENPGHSPDPVVVPVRLVIRDST